MNQDESRIWVFAEKDEVLEFPIDEGKRSSSDTGGGFGSPSNVATAVTRLLKKERIPLDAHALKAQMNGLMQVVGDLFKESEKQTGMCLDEVTLSVEINAEGQIGIVGNGGKLGNTGGITLKFTRPPQT